MKLARGEIRGFFVLSGIIILLIISKIQPEVMFVVLWIIVAAICGFIGQNKKIGFMGAFLLSLLLTPIIGFIVALLSPEDVPEQQPVQNVEAAEAKIDKRASLTEQLHQLYDLKEKGAISQDEFDKLKAKMLTSEI